jgi:dATP pyrophosphohydrolase
MIQEHCFAVEVTPGAALTLSREHDECGWFEYARCVELLRWDGNRSALWELHHRINHDLWEP